ncbi:MAG TPA: hypothetical protein VM802_27380 [Chitinophaga sp.]|uniref:hypothetical protein n=1 Tax=Chitinophaga sp. TaxID=1869181 RepID=UPI002BBEEBF9|nr:hypothetical protein [Chitinophaga sp.]HVI48621.1 hypothetical protein [Chitinophaga sp.]
MIRHALLILSSLLVFSAAQAQSKYVSFNDTRNINEPPDSFYFQTRFDFKDRGVVGAPGSGMFSGTMTIAPWSDATGGGVHQMTFNEGGIFYRLGIRNQGWQAWRRILTDNSSQTINGALTLMYDDRPLSFQSSKPATWQYIEFNGSAGRKAWAGMDPSNNFNIVRENGGNIILRGGNVGINTENPGPYALAVEGTIGARRVRVTQVLPWADFVFNNDYKLLPLKEVKDFIEQHKHLPDIPSAKEVAEDGIDVGEMNKKLLQKIEELTLYIIQQDKKLDDVKKELEQLKKER